MVSMQLVASKCMPVGWCGIFSWCHWTRPVQKAWVCFRKGCYKGETLVQKGFDVHIHGWCSLPSKDGSKPVFSFFKYVNPSASKGRKWQKASSAFLFNLTRKLPRCLLLGRAPVPPTLSKVFSMPSKRSFVTFVEIHAYNSREPKIFSNLLLYFCA